MSISEHADLFPDNQLSEYAADVKSNLRIFYLLNLPRLIQSLMDKSCKLFVHMNVADPKIKPQMVLQYVLGPQAGAMAIVRLCVPTDCFDINLEEEEPYVSAVNVTNESDYEIVKGGESVEVKAPVLCKRSYQVSLKSNLGDLTVKGMVYLQYLQRFKELVQAAINEQCQRMESPPYPSLVPLNDDFVGTGRFKVSREVLPYSKNIQKKVADDAAHIAKFEATKKVVEESQGARVFTCSLNYLIANETDKTKRKIYPWFQMIHGAVYKVKEPSRSKGGAKKKAPSAKKPFVSKSYKRDREEADDSEEGDSKRLSSEQGSDDEKS